MFMTIQGKVVPNPLNEKTVDSVQTLSVVSLADYQNQPMTALTINTSDDGKWGNTFLLGKHLQLTETVMSDRNKLDYIYLWVLSVFALHPPRSGLSTKRHSNHHSGYLASADKQHSISTDHEI